MFGGVEGAGAVILAAGVFAHGAGGAAGGDGVCGVAVEVLAGRADARVLPVGGVVNFWLIAGRRLWFGVRHIVRGGFLGG